TRNSVMQSSPVKHCCPESVPIPEQSGVLGVFTGLNATGGIEASGRLAWETLRKGKGERSFLLCHRSEKSKIQTVRAALSRRWPVEMVMFWHLGLLKLLPFL